MSMLIVGKRFGSKTWIFNVAIVRLSLFLGTVAVAVGRAFYAVATGRRVSVREFGAFFPRGHRLRLATTALVVCFWVLAAFMGPLDGALRATNPRNTAPPEKHLNVDAVRDKLSELQHKIEFLEKRVFIEETVASIWTANATALEALADEVKQQKGDFWSVHKLKEEAGLMRHAATRRKMEAVSARTDILKAQVDIFNLKTFVFNVALANTKLIGVSYEPHTTTRASVFYVWGWGLAFVDAAVTLVTLVFARRVANSVCVDNPRWDVATCIEACVGMFWGVAACCELWLLLEAGMPTDWSWLEDGDSVLPVSVFFVATVVVCGLSVLAAIVKK